MKVLLVVPYLSSGGAERVASIWASELAKIGADINLLVFYRVDQEYFIDEGVKIYSIIENKTDYDKLSGIMKILKLRKKLKEIKPSVIIPFISHVGIMATISKFGLGIKIIETIRNNPKTNPNSKKMRLMRNISIICADKCIVQNKKQLEYFPKFIQKKSKVFFNPISPEYISIEKNYQDKIENLVAVGRLVEQKDYFTMIDSVEILLKSNKNINLSIYGEGPLFNDLKKYIKSKNLTNSVVLQGRVSNIKEIILEKDMYILSSKWEGMPNALMEAMCAGLPCISTNCETGPSDLINNGINGYLVPVGDSVALADLIIEMIENPSVAIELGKNARKSILNKYSPEEISEKLLDFISSV